MLKPIFIALLSFLLPFSSISFNLFSGNDKSESKANTGTLEKMIVANGNVAMELDLNRLNGKQDNAKVSKGNQRLAKQSNLSRLQFDIETESFFTVIVYNDELRGPTPSSMNIIPRSNPSLPSKLSASFDQLLIEQMPFGEEHELVIRDRKSGFIFFTIEGHLFKYDSTEQNLNMNSGRIRISKEFAQAMGRPNEAGTVVGNIDVNATLRAIEITELVDGEIQSNVLPAGAGKPENAGTRPGPDVVVGDVFNLTDFGGSGTKVGLALGTTSCNYGTENLNWFQLPNNDHPVIPQNLYRMSSDGTRFEQVGQSQVKHAFTALTQNLCGLGCNGTGGSRLGSGCSDPYSASLNSGPNLGSKAWINPFTGFYPRGDSGSTNPNTHSGHSHDGTTHRILVEQNDLNTQMNVGAKYFAEGQYVTPHEYQWCQSNPTQCHMNNNVSYREYTVSGTSRPFGFSPVGSTVREAAAIEGWTGSSSSRLQPDATNDGIGTVAYKVTETSPGVWHYEYAIYNQNLDRGIQSFSVPVGNGVSLTNVGFYAPPQHPGSLNDGSMNNAGFSSTPWSQNRTTTNLTWSSETLAQNPNANAIRWGTMYNFRFDSTSPPQTTNATIGFFKTGSPIMVQVQGPSGPAVSAASVSGRVTSSGSGVPFAQVLVENPGLGGNEYRATTNQFGYYRIDGVITGQTYMISVESKGYDFTPQQMQINDNITGLNFEANP